MELKALWIDIDLSKLGTEAKHLITESDKNGHKYISLTLSPRKEAPAWDEWEVYALSAYDKDGEEGKKNIYLGSGKSASWDRGEKPEAEELPTIKEQEDKPADDLPWA
jgi:hypothetical protein